MQVSVVSQWKWGLSCWLPLTLRYDRAHAKPARWMPATAIWAQVTAAVREPSPRCVHDTDPSRLPPRKTHYGQHFRLTGVLDWTQASRGPPALDLGHMGWNLVADHGQAAADGSWPATG